MELPYSSLGLVWGGQGGAKGQQLASAPRTHGSGESGKEKGRLWGLLVPAERPQAPPCLLILPCDEGEELGTLWSWQVTHTVKENPLYSLLRGL